MRVISGAGEFEISVDRVEVRGGTVVLLGRMGIWDAETIINEAEIGRLVRVALRPRLLGWVAAGPLRTLWRRLRGGEAEAG